MDTARRQSSLRSHQRQEQDKTQETLVSGNRIVSASLTGGTILYLGFCFKSGTYGATCYTGCPKKDGTVFLVRLNFIKY